MKINIIILTSMFAGGLLTFFLTNILVNFSLRKKLPNAETPITVNIVKTTLFICAGLLLNELMISLQALNHILSNAFTGNTLLVKILMYFSLFLALTLCILIAVAWLSYYMFSMIDKGRNILIETANNNFHAVILYSGLVIALTIAVMQGCTLIFDNLIPYPTVPVYH